MLSLSVNMLNGQEGHREQAYEALKFNYLQNFEFLQSRQGLWVYKSKVIASQPSGKDCSNSNNINNNRQSTAYLQLSTIKSSLHHNVQTLTHAANYTVLYAVAITQLAPFKQITSGIIYLLFTYLYIFIPSSRELRVVY